MSGEVVAAAVEWARPEWLWAGLLAVPVVLLHLHRRKRLVVPFLPLLLEGLGRARPSGGWRRLRDVLALCARLLALGAIVLALAGLRPAPSGPPPEDLVVVVDADVTTAAREADGRSRLARTFDVARAHVLSAPWREVTVVVAREEPSVLAGPTRERERVASVLAREASAATAAAGRADLSRALRVAASAATDAPGGRRIVVVSAREVPGDEASPPRVVGAGRTDDDQGFVDFVLRGPPARAWTGSSRVGVETRVRNEASLARSRRFVARLGDDVVHEESLELTAGEERGVAFEVERPRDGAWLRATLEGSDAFERNDRAVAWLAAAVRPSVLVVHGGAVRPYLRAVLDALGDGIDADASGTVGTGDLARAAMRDVVVVDGAELPPGSLRPGAWLFLAPIAGDVPFSVGGPVMEPVVWRTAERDPLVRDVDLAAAYVGRGYPVEAPEAEGLAFAEGKTLIARGEREGVRYVAIGLDPEGSDLPLRAAFPLLVRNALRSLATAPREPLLPAYRVGDAVRPRAPLAGGPAVTLRLGAGREIPARLSPEGETWHAAADAVGEVEVVRAAAREGDGAVRTAVNDLDATRSVRPVREEEPLPAAVAIPEPAESAWRLGLLAAAALLLVLDLGLTRAWGRRGREAGAGRWAAARGIVPLVMS